MKNQSGFTFIEMVLVFSIVLVISTVTAFLLRPHYLVFEKEGFYSRFKADLLYSQQYAISQQKHLSVFIIPEEKRYYVKEKLTGKHILDREIPDSITVEQGTLGNLKITFDYMPNGGIDRFGSIYFIVGDQRYKITFQLGAGRFYVEEA